MEYENLDFPSTVRRLADRVGITIQEDKYKPNQFVVHPHHGAAKVVRKVNKNVEIFDENL